MARIRPIAAAAALALLALGLAVNGATLASAAPAAASTAKVAGASSALPAVNKAALGAAATPQVFPSTGAHGFTPQGPFWSFGDGNGSGAEQINYSTSTEMWGYQIGAALRAVIVGNVVENANLYCGSALVTNYGQHVVPSNYQFHGSRGGIGNSCVYHTTIRISYQTGTGGGVLTAQWNWVKTFV
jgi:hypothetical protein